jgi:hypothetical protein
MTLSPASGSQSRNDGVYALPTCTNQLFSWSKARQKVSFFQSASCPVAFSYHIHTTTPPPLILFSMSITDFLSFFFSYICIHFREANRIKQKSPEKWFKL